MIAWKIHRLPRYLRYWRPLTGAGGFHSPVQRRDAILILSAEKIPWRLHANGNREHLYVPALYENWARTELDHYHAEIKPRASAPALKLHQHWRLAALYVVPLIIVHGLKPFGWENLGSLQGAAVLLRHEWARLGTALTLHADWGHVAGNAFFGALFLCVLARLCGVGHAWLLAFLGGFLGNGLSVFLHSAAYASIGFSTSVFAALGALGGVYISQKNEKLYLPLAATLALLALLGTEGIHTDYVAHLCGLTCGLCLGVLEGTAIRRGWPLPPQWLAALLAIGLPILCWHLVL